MPSSTLVLLILTFKYLTIVSFVSRNDNLSLREDRNSQLSLPIPPSIYGVPSSLSAPRSHLTLTLPPCFPTPPISMTFPARPKFRLLPLLPLATSSLTEMSRRPSRQWAAANQQMRKATKQSSSSMVSAFWLAIWLISSTIRCMKVFLQYGHIILSIWFTSQDPPLIPITTERSW